VTRRRALESIGGALGGATMLARNGSSQSAAEKNGGPKAGAAKGDRTKPLLCGYSKNLARVPYPELGLIAQQIGYDGVDLTVMDGGHVNPHITNVDLVRAIESVRGAGLEVPMISTTLTSVREPTTYPILAISGHTDVHYYRTGFWPWGPAANPQRRLQEVRNDLQGLLAAGRQYEMIAMLPNRSGGFVSEAVWDAQVVLGDLDPALIGYYFDPSQTQAWESALRLTLPRLKAVALQDFYWEKTGGAWAMKTCPLGQGMVDWALFFRILAEARFTGPVSVRFEYHADDEPGALAKDVEFVRKQIQTAWV
jgi:sugar phosphate isomerase/epimerase